jgi:outer membrane protein assembly factor BamA
MVRWTWFDIRWSWVGGGRKLSRLCALLASAVLGLPCSSTLAQTDSRPEPQTEDAVTKLEKSPWLLAPVFQSNPKLGTSLGAMAGYIHYFDEKSRPSVFAVMAQHSNTDSTIAGAQAKTSFDEDRQRVLAGLLYGYVRNDYSDYLGTGVPLHSNGELKSFIGRYTYRVKGDWFVGVQGIYQNMAVTGETQFDNDFLNLVGVRPYDSGGAGLVAQYDSRDSENSPTKGWLLNLNNIAYREWLGGNDNFDVVRAEARYYWAHGTGNVLAVRQLNHFTSDAPTQVKAPVQLRGYKVGQYNGDYMSSIEVEERLRLGEKFTATLFAGIACTYGGGKSCSDSDNQFPAAGAGVQYRLKPKEGIVLNLEYAQGKNDNYGVYLKIGYAY